MTDLSPEAKEALEDKSPPKTPYPKGFPRQSPYHRVAIFKKEKLKDWAYKTRKERA